MTSIPQLRKDIAGLQSKIWELEHENKQLRDAPVKVVEKVVEKVVAGPTVYVDKEVVRKVKDTAEIDRLKQELKDVKSKLRKKPKSVVVDKVITDTVVEYVDREVVRKVVDTADVDRLTEENKTLRAELSRKPKVVVEHVLPSAPQIVYVDKEVVKYVKCPKQAALIRQLRGG